MTDHIIYDITARSPPDYMQAVAENAGRLITGWQVVWGRNGQIAMSNWQKRQRMEDRNSGLEVPKSR